MKAHVSAATQDQAFCAIVLLYRKVFYIELDSKIEALRAKRPKRRPSVLTPEEVFLIFDELEDHKYRIMAGLLYGCGLRIRACMSLRVKEADFGNRGAENVHTLPSHPSISLNAPGGTSPASPSIQRHISVRNSHAL